MCASCKTQFSTLPDLDILFGKQDDYLGQYMCMKTSDYHSKGFGLIAGYTTEIRSTGSGTEFTLPLEDNSEAA